MGGSSEVQSTVEFYNYEIITEKQPDLIRKAAECLTHSFIGLEVSGKWVQEPLVGQLNISFDDLYTFMKEYLEAAVGQGYCIVARDRSDNVVGALAGDTNAPEIICEDVFEGSFSDMNVILRVLGDVDKRFMEDYERRNGKKIKDGELLHLFVLGVTAETGRHEIIQQMASRLIEKATAEGVEAVLAEATNPKSIRVMDKYHNMKRYTDLQGNFIVHKYEDNPKLKGIPSIVADGTYILLKEL